MKNAAKMKAVRERLGQLGQDANSVLIDPEQRLIVSRILGYENVAHGIDQWKCQMGDDAACWICERFKFTMMLVN